MKNSLKKLLSRIEQDTSGRLKEGFAVLKGIRGGNLPPDSNSTGTCTNTYTCSGTNSNNCDNTRDCSGSSNSATCTNSGTKCFA